MTGKASLIHLRPPSSGTTGPKALSYLVLLDIYWTHKWYIYVLPKIDKLTFSDAPPFCPFPCHNRLTGFKLGRTNATHLRRMSWGPSLNVVHWGHPFDTTRYTEVILWWRGCVRTGHHAMYLLWVGAMYRYIFGNKRNVKLKGTTTQSFWCAQCPPRWR